jgi:PAS domain S-box-containing protein
LKPVEQPADLGYQQALRYAAELRELYETERARRADLEAAQVKLREAEAKYRALVEHIPAVTYLDVVDPNDPRMARELYMSPQIEVMLGYTADEVVGNPDMWYRLVHPDDRARAQRADLEHYDTGEPLDQEYRMVARDGRVVWVRDMAAIMRDDDGRPRYAQGVVFDITDRKVAEEAERRYTERLESLRKIDLAILAAESTEELIRAALSRLRNLIPCERATVSLIDFDTDEVVVFASTLTGATSFAPGARLPLKTLGAFGDQVIERLRSGRVDVLGDLAAVPDLPPSLQTARDEGVRSVLSAPLLSQGDLIGALSLSATEASAFQAEHAEIASEVANQLAIAIRQGRLHEALTQELAERRRAEERLRETLADLQKTDEVRQRLLSHLTMAQEEERSRIAADIHDDTIQVMTAVGMRLDILRRELQRPEQTELLEEVEETVRVATSRLRNLLFELHPPTLDRDGLAAALRIYLEQNREQTGVAYTLEDRMAGEPPAETRVILYRVAQEVLANARKHARASSLNVVLESRDGGYLVRIADDGVGFTASEDEYQRPGHMGLASIRERAEMAGGWSRIESTPGDGTTVEFWLPETSPERREDGR